MTEERVVRINNIEFAMFSDSSNVDIGVHRTVKDIKGFDVESGERVFFLRRSAIFFEEGVLGDEPSSSFSFDLRQDDMDVISSRIESAVRGENDDVTHEISNMIFDDFFEVISNSLRFFGTRD